MVDEEHKSEYRRREVNAGFGSPFSIRFFPRGNTMSVSNAFRRLVVVAATLSCTAFFSACDDDDSSPPASNIIRCDDEPATGSAVERSAGCELRDADGWIITDSIPAGEARLGMVREDVRPFSGPEARCGKDDYILQNEHIRVCISGKSSNQLFFEGGRIIDIEDPANPGHEFMEFATASFGLSELGGERFTVLNDGSDGGTAVLRVSGIDLPLKLEAGALGEVLLSTPAGIRFETEYRLDPDAPVLEAVTWYTMDDQITPDTPREVGELMFPGDTADYFSVPYGIGKPKPTLPVDYFASISPDASFGVYFDSELHERVATGSGTSNILSTLVSSLVVVEALKVPIQKNTEHVYRRWFAVGGPNTTDIERAFGTLEQYARRDVARTTVTFNSANSIASDARWIVERKVQASPDATVDWVAEGVVSLADGSGTIDLPDGEFRTRAIHWPTRNIDELTFTVPADASIDLPSPNAGFIVANVVDQDGNAVPSQIRLSGSEVRTHYDIGRSEPFAVEAGTWDLEASLGEEYSLGVATGVQVAAGETTTVDITLNRVLDTTNWVSGDMHQHANRSPDSEVSAVNRALSNYTAGVDFFAPSDHEHVEDFRGIVAGMGLQDQLYVFQGQEISPIRAHMNAFPMEYRNAETAGGAVPLAVRVEGGDGRQVRQLTQPEMAERARERGARLIQINHARDGSLPFFDTVGLDPLTVQPTKEFDQWFEDFESMEIFNEFDAACTLMRDFFSFHRHGKILSGVGNSDTHTLSSPAGYPRNYLFIDGDTQADITDDALIDAINAHRVVISGGLFMDFTNGTLPGDTITASGTYDAHLRIQSPEWAKADVLITYVNGIETNRQTISSNAEDTVDFDGIVSVPVTEDSFVVFLAFGNDKMEHVTEGKYPFGMTNPVFVDVDGNGYTPPGVSSLADVPKPRALPWCGEPLVED